MEDFLDDGVADAIDVIEAALREKSPGVGLEQRRLMLLTLMRNGLMIASRGNRGSYVKMFVDASRALEDHSRVH